MKAVASTAALVLALVAAFLGAGPATAADWVRYSDAKLGFEALFPAAPTVESSTDKDGTSLSTIVGTDGAGAACIVVVGSYVGVIPSVPAELAANRDNFVKGVNGKVTSSKSTTFAAGGKDLPAMEFDAASEQAVFRSIVIVHGLKNVAQVAGMAMNGIAPEAPLEQCVRNFKLL